MGLGCNDFDCNNVANGIISLKTPLKRFVFNHLFKIKKVDYLIATNIGKQLRNFSEQEDFNIKNKFILLLILLIDYEGIMKEFVVFVVDGLEKKAKKRCDQ